MLQEMLMMLGLGDILDQDFADLVEIDRSRVYVEDDERHEHLARLEDQLRDVAVVRYPEGFDRHEWIEGVIDDDAAIVDQASDMMRRPRRAQDERRRRDDDEDAGDDLSEYESDSGEG